MSPVRRLWIANLTLFIVASVLAILAVTGGHLHSTVDDKPIGTVVTSTDGITCTLGAPYVDGGGLRPAMVFDEQCRPVAWT